VSPLGHKILNSAWFRLLVMCIILSNGIAMATMNFKHDGRQREEFYQQYYYIEVFIFNIYWKLNIYFSTFFQVVYTIIFNFETLFKMVLLGFKEYFKHSYHKFELMLAVGTTLHIFPQFYLSGLTYFQVRYSSSLK